MSLIRDKIAQRILDGFGQKHCDDGTCERCDDEMLAAREVADRILDDIDRTRIWSRNA